MRLMLRDQFQNMRLVSSDSSVRLSEEDSLEMADELLEYDRFAIKIESVVWTRKYHIVHYLDVDGNELTFVKSYSTRSP